MSIMSELNSLRERNAHAIRYLSGVVKAMADYAADCRRRQEEAERTNDPDAALGYQYQADDLAARVSQIMRAVDILNGVR